LGSKPMQFTPNSVVPCEDAGMDTLWSLCLEWPPDATTAFSIG
jgi:hypothetical protein